MRKLIMVLVILMLLTSISFAGTPVDYQWTVIFNNCINLTQENLEKNVAVYKDGIKVSVEVTNENDTTLLVSPLNKWEYGASYDLVIKENFLSASGYILNQRVVHEFTIEPKVEKEVVQELEVHFIDVNQGDCIFIQSGTGTTVLIDAGTRTAGEKVVSYLKKAGISSIDIVIGTHPHEDHIGGLISVFQNFEVGEVIDPGVVHTTKTYEDYLNLIDQHNIKFTEGRAGMIRDLGGGASMQVIHPDIPSSRNLNNASVVTRLTYGEISFLFTGDAEKEAEAEILSRGYTIKSDILKVGHHGSITSTNQGFLNNVNPDIAVIMVGEGNKYGHPSDEVLARLTTAGVKIYRTDIHGDIVVFTNGKSYQVNVQPWVYQPQPVPVTPEPEPTPAPDTVKININTASYEELQEIVNIGPDRAEEIINKRPFKTLDELTRISGIGPARLEQIKNQGIAYID